MGNNRLTRVRKPRDEQGSNPASSEQGGASVVVLEENAQVPTGATTISIGKVPGDIVEVEVKGGETIRDCFSKAQIGDVNNCEIQKNGKKATLDDTTVSPGDSIIAIANIRGN